MSYAEFIKSKRQPEQQYGFSPLWMPDFLFDFQRELCEWSIRKGRASLYEDCGLGKTPQQLVWAQNVLEKTNKPVLILTPLAVSPQTVREGEKFGIECEQSRDGKYKSGIVVTNYERLHYFDWSDFSGVVCDESSAIKHFTSRRQKDVTEFMRRIEYRLLCTATPAPNDYIELGTSSEALGYLGRMDMLGMFFKNDENSLHPIWYGSKWHMKKHSEKSFWRWICSWARAIRKPSDLGFDDSDFVLPPLNMKQITIDSTHLRDGFGLKLAITLDEQRAERKKTIGLRCDKVAEIVSKQSPNVVWCHLNAEGDMLERVIPGAVQVSGSDSDEVKEKRFLDFARGEIHTLVTKPKIGCFGMNWQHCSNMTFFPSHSFEQFYQSTRRCWRYGQENPVNVTVVTSTGESGVLMNLKRKAKAADDMFAQLVSEMGNAMGIKPDPAGSDIMEAPRWL